VNYIIKPKPKAGKNKKIIFEVRKSMVDYRKGIDPNWNSIARAMFRAKMWVKKIKKRGHGPFRLRRRIPYTDMEDYIRWSIVDISYRDWVPRGRLDIRPKAKKKVVDKR
jgi:hypothetical protein